MRDSEKELKGLMKKYESLRKKKKGLFGGIKSAFKSLASKAVSIGGGISRQCLSLPLMQVESAHLTGPLSRAVRGVRFVDDLLALSTNDH